MLDTGKSVLIGVFVLAAICLLVFLVLFLHPTTGNLQETIRVRFANIERVQQGTRVTFAGEPVGRVDRIIDIFDGKQNPREFNGPMYFFELILKVDSHVQVYETDQITIRSSGFFGERTVAIIPKRMPEGVVLKRVTADTIMYATSEDAVDQALTQLVAVSGKMGGAFDKLSLLIDNNADDIHIAVVNFGTALGEISSTFKSVNEEKVIVSVSGITNSVNRGLDELERGGFWGNLNGIADSIADITQTIASGRGSVGQLVKSEDLYLSVQSLLSKGDVLMNDINHYGLLFHQNRRWQRERTKRANLLDALSTPAGFQNYFQCEVDQIATSLTRVNVLLQKACYEGQGTAILCNPCFRDEFANLLRHAKALESRLELYNQRLAECECPCN